MRSTEMMKEDRAAEALGISVDEDGDGCAVASMQVVDDMANGFGITHGGFVFLLADTAFAYACNNSDESTVAASAEITYLRPSRVGQRLVAVAQRRVEFGRSGIYDVTVSDEAGTVIAEFRGHSRVLPAASR